MSISVEVRGGQELEHIQKLIARMSDTGNRSKLLNLIGAEAETQTHRRIRDEKTAPDGTPWDEWSEQYAKTRHGNHSLLMGEGALDDSIQFYIQGKGVHLGSPLAYASIPQDGFEGIVNVSAHTREVTEMFGRVLDSPVQQSVKAHTRHMSTPQRQYLGLSNDNEQDLLALIGDFYSDLLK